MKNSAQQNTEFKKPDVVVLSLAHLAHDTFSAFLAPLLPLLIDKLGMSLSMTAFLEILFDAYQHYSIPFLAYWQKKLGLSILLF